MTYTYNSHLWQKMILCLMDYIHCKNDREFKNGTIKTCSLVNGKFPYYKRWINVIIFYNVRIFVNEVNFPA